MRLIAHAALSGVIISAAMIFLNVPANPETFIVAAVAFLLGVSLPYIALK